MAPRTRLPGTLDKTKAEGGSFTTGGNIGPSRLVVTADAVEAEASAVAAAASAAAALTSENNADTSEAAAAASAAAALTSENNADTSEAAAAASAAAAAVLVADNGVTNAKLRDSVALSVIGRSANSTGDPGDIAAGSDAYVLRRSGTTLGFGEVATAGLANDAVTDTKLRNAAALSVIGRSANSTGDPADIAAGSDGYVLRRSGTTLGFGEVATAGLANNAVTLGKMATTATATFLGRTTAGTGNVEALTAAQMRAAITDSIYLPFTGGNLTGNLRIDATPALIRLHDTGGTVNTRQFATYSESNVYGIAAYNDAAVFQRALITLPHRGGVQVTQWPTANRPTGLEGLLGYNTESDQFEYYDGVNWHTLTASFGTTGKRYEVNNVAAVDIALPSGAWGMTVKGLWKPSSGANLRLRVSHDNASSFPSGASDYKTGYIDVSGTTAPVTNVFTTDYILVGCYIGTDHLFPFEFTVSSGGGREATVGSFSHGNSAAGTSNPLLAVTGYRNGVTTAITHVRLFAAVNIAHLRYRVEPF